MATSPNVMNNIYPIDQSCGSCRGTGVMMVGEDDLPIVCTKCNDSFILKVERLCKTIINSKPEYADDWQQHIQFIHHHLLDLGFDARKILEQIHCNPIQPDEDQPIPF